ncbi:membrane or secreted protein, partial [Candidatus Magnetoovum chiemensis]
MQKLINYLRNTNTVFSIFIALVFIALSYLFLREPIRAGDTDLWYHLS